jgi:hypothetical protein
VLLRLDENEMGNDERAELMEVVKIGVEMV